MNTYPKALIVTLLLVLTVIGISFLTAYNVSNGQSVGGIVQGVPNYDTASSTLYSVGHQLSTKVLDSYSRRAYARICNDTPNNGGSSQDIYLVFSSTAVTATSSADQVIENDECYEITNDFLYTGEVQIITNVSTTTGVFVTELRD